MKVTAAVANKIVKELQDKLAFLYQKVNQESTYTEVVGQEPIIPEYHFRESWAEIKKLEDKIVAIKHSINAFNIDTSLDGPGGLTIDQALVKMAQYNKRLDVLDKMRGRAQKVLDNSSGYFGNKQAVQYTVANYDPKEATAEYQSLYSCIRSLQTALDVVNNTVTFEIPYED